MSCRTCGQLICVNPADLDLYSLQSGFNFRNTNLAFLVSCPEGMRCQPGFYPRVVTVPEGTIVVPVPPNPQGQTITLQCCQSAISETIPASATTSEITSIINDMIYRCAQQQAECDNIVTGPPGVPPPAPPGTPVQPPHFRNQVVTREFSCDETVDFTGVLPSWITYDGLTTFTGMAGVYSATTQALANAAAQQALNNFVAVEIAAGRLVCTPDPGPPPDCDLAIDDNTDYGTATPSPASTNSVTFTAPDQWGQFRVDYVNGAYLSASNPHPGAWKAVGYSVSWSNSSFNLNFSPWIDGFASQAAVEAALAGQTVGFTPTWPAVDTSIKMNFTGSNSGLVNGSPNPTFRLTRTKKLSITLPERLRIKNWNTVKAQLTGCASCADSGNPEWDGTFTEITSVSGTFIQYRALGTGKSIAGKSMGNCFVFFNNANPSESGCGWTLQIGCLTGGASFVYMWEGFKLSGNHPTGQYALMDFNGHVPCSDSPLVIELESY